MLEHKSSSGSKSGGSLSSSLSSGPVTLFGANERPREVAGTRADVTLQRLEKLEAELERALNSRTMAFISAKDPTPHHPHIVLKWVDYTNKYGIGYMLSNGSVGCMVRELPTQYGDRVVMCPASSVMVSGAEEHFQRRKDATYADRHQPTPMNEPIRFYELNRETGMSMVTVSPEMFRISINDDGTPTRMGQGKDLFEHRKRERIIVWKRFASYMAARGRDESVLVDAPPDDGYGDEGAELVTFYQGLGEVRCWAFGDGHLQVCSPTGSGWISVCS
jgi:hypothetical protein